MTDQQDSAQPEPMAFNDDFLRRLWREAGGKFHGPNVETGTMPESKLLPFLRAIASAAPTTQPAEPINDGPEFTDMGRSALLWVLWHHQGGSSPVGQAMRFALGMGAHDRLIEHQVASAKKWGAFQELSPAEPAAPAAQSEIHPARVMAWELKDAAAAAHQPPQPDEALITDAQCDEAIRQSGLWSWAMTEPGNLSRLRGLCRAALASQKGA